MNHFLVILRALIDYAIMGFCFYGLYIHTSLGVFIPALVAYIVLFVYTEKMYRGFQ